MAAGAVVGRGEHRRGAAVLDQAGHGPRVELGPVGEHDERVRHVVAERREAAAQRRARARRPSPAQWTSVTPSNLVRTGSRVQAPSTTTIGDSRPGPALRARRAGARAASAAVARRRAGGEHDRGDASLDADGRVLDLDRLGRLLGAARRRACRCGRRPRAPDDAAEHGVLRRQARVRAGDDEELTAARSGRLRLRLRHRDDPEACNACSQAADRRSCTRGRRVPVAVGSPPWMMKPGTMRWKTVLSKKPLRTSETNEAVVFGEVLTSSEITKLPQFVCSVTSYVFAASSGFDGLVPCRSSVDGALTD